MLNITFDVFVKDILFFMVVLTAFLAGFLWADDPFSSIIMVVLTAFFAGFLWADDPFSSIITMIGGLGFLLIYYFMQK